MALTLSALSKEAVSRRVRPSESASPEPLLRDRAVMLFDEATSALDPETERNLLKNILGRHDKTIIFITHRPAVVDYCDQTLHVVRTIEHSHKPKADGGEKPAEPSPVAGKSPQ